MDEVVKLNEIEKKDYAMKIYSDRLLGLSKQCSVDGAWSKSTGEMILLLGSSRWLVKYFCPAEEEFFQLWTPDVDSLTKQIAKDLLENPERE